MNEHILYFRKNKNQVVVDLWRPSTSHKRCCNFLFYQICIDYFSGIILKTFLSIIWNQNMIIYFEICFVVCVNIIWIWLITCIVLNYRFFIRVSIREIFRNRRFVNDSFLCSLSNTNLFVILVNPVVKKVQMTCTNFRTHSDRTRCHLGYNVSVKWTPTENVMDYYYL